MRGGEPAEMLLSLSFTRKHGRLILDAFGYDGESSRLLGRIKPPYPIAGIREKRRRFVASPYPVDLPRGLRIQGGSRVLPVPSVAPGGWKTAQIDDHLELFYEWSAPLQIPDDLMDLEDDLRNVHHPCPTMGFDEAVSRQSPEGVTRAVRPDMNPVRRLRQI